MDMERNIRNVSTSYPVAACSRVFIIEHNKMNCAFFWQWFNVWNTSNSREEHFDKPELASHAFEKGT